jgi:hypothetical protein
LETWTRVQSPTLNSFLLRGVFCTYVVKFTSVSASVKTARLFSNKIVCSITLSISGFLQVT